MSEVWKTVEGFNDRYEVSTYGKVRNVQRGKLLTPYINRFGYMSVKLFSGNKGKEHKVHRLVAQAFIENPEQKPCVNHKDNNKQNNHVENLEWCTYQENTDWMFEQRRNPTLNSQKEATKRYHGKKRQITCLFEKELFLKMQETGQSINKLVNAAVKQYLETRAEEG